MVFFKKLGLVIVVSQLFGCGGGGSDATPIDRQPVEQQPIILPLNKVDVDPIEVQIEPIDFMFVSGPENEIKSWNQQILIPSRTGLNIFELDENGFIDKSNNLLAITADVTSVSDNIIAAIENNSIAFYDYDGESMNEIGRSETANLSQIPFDALDNCFYWVQASDNSEITHAVQEACYVNGEFTYDEIISSELFISNILVMPDSRMIVTSGNRDGSFIQLYVKKNGAYTLTSRVQEENSWSFLDLEYRDNFLFAYTSPSDVPGMEGEGGLIRYDISNNTFNSKLQLAEIITDNAQYDIIGITPDGIILADDKKLKHIIGVGQNIEKVVYANIENSVTSVYYADDYIITVLRDPPSSFRTGEQGSQGIHIYPYQPFVN